MYLIKVCPDCGKKLRFPIDRGIIKVKCPCGFSFVADPDDTGIYTDAKFDLKGKNKPPKAKNIDLGNLKERMILAILQYKYNLQNFKLLPWKNRRNVIMTTVVVVFIVVLIVMFIVSIKSCGSSPAVEQNII